jgi:hypothetical protein
MHHVKRGRTSESLHSPSRWLFHPETGRVSMPTVSASFASQPRSLISQIRAIRSSPASGRQSTTCTPRFQQDSMFDLHSLPPRGTSDGSQGRVSCTCPDFCGSKAAWKVTRLLGVMKRRQYPIQSIRQHMLQSRWGYRQKRSGVQPEPHLTILLWLKLLTSNFPREYKGLDTPQPNSILTNPTISLGQYQHVYF